MALDSQIKVLFLQIRLLLWKDFLRQIRSILYTLLEIILPCLLLILIIIFNFVNYKNSNIQRKFEDYFISTFILSLIISISFVISIVFAVRTIIDERESHLKEYMKIMGMRTLAHWTSTFITTYTKFLIFLIFATIYEKLSFPGSNVFLMILMNLILALYSVLFAFLLSTVSKSTTVGTLLAACVHMIFFIWNFIILIVGLANLEMKQTPTIKWYECFNAQLLYTGFLYTMTNHQTFGDGLNFSNFTGTAGKYDSFSGLFYMAMLLVHCFVLLLATWYVDAVLPRGDGIGLKWYFFLTPDYWGCGKEKPTTIDGDNLQVDNCLYREEVETSEEPLIKIQSLWKSYEENTISHLKKSIQGDSLTYAVKNLSMNIYEHKIMALLGHNGAGKTSCIKVLTGVHSPTKGNVFINNLDIKTRMSDIRKDLGFCPQHNILLNFLTPMEHLQFFCELKGQVFYKAEALELLRKIQMVDKQNFKAEKLSGGQKRKLSLAIALIGSSKIIILDEPSAGVDVHSCREIWNLLLAEKLHRTILITTHYMEEADVLSDRIAIMANGKLQCVGSPLYLKKTFGAGYHLNAQFIEHDGRRDIVDRNVDNVFNLLKLHCPEVRLQSHYAEHAIYVLSDKYRSFFPEMLEELERHKKNLGVLSYGISISTMDEVFLKVTSMESDKFAHNNLEDADGNEGRRLGELIARIKESDRNSGMHLYCQQFYALQVKQIRFMIKKWVMYGSLFCIPTIAYCVLMYFLYDDIVGRNYDYYDNGKNNTKAKYTHQTKDFLDFGGYCTYFFPPITSALIIIPMSENISKFKHLQLMSGTKAWVYWLSVAIFGMFFYFVCIGIMLTTFSIFLVQFGDDVGGICLRYAGALVLFCWANLPFTFCLIFFIKSFTKGFFIILILTFILPIVQVIVEAIMDTTEETPTKYNLMQGPSNVRIGIEYVMACLLPIINLNDILGKSYQNVDLDYVDPDTVVYNDVANFIIFIVQGFFFWVVTFLFELEKLNFLIPGCSCFSKSQKSRGPGVDMQDDDVIEEIDYVNTCESSSHAVVVKNLKKSYGSHDAVRGVSFHVDYSQIFGLLGVNGAGKTSVFSCLTRQTPITSGEAYLNNQNVSSLRSGSNRIGYCPQFDTIAEELTGESVLYLFARVSGIPNSHISFFVNAILDGLDLQAYAKNSISTYSGGCKRRLSLAASLIGGPDTVILDEPSAGVDPQAKRLIWEVLRTVQKKNTAIILTSHSMEEIEVLCSTMTIMIAGKFRCYGSPQHIKNKYGSGYSVVFKVNSKTNVSQMLERFLYTFKNSRVVIQEAHQISLEIPKDESILWHRLFSTCEKYLEKYNVSDYFIGQTTLEQIFNDFSTNEINTKDFKMKMN